MDSHGAPPDDAGALLPGRSGQDTLTSGLFAGSRVLLLFVGDAVYRRVHRQRRERQARDGPEVASTGEASRDGRPLVERYQRKHHTARKAPSTNPCCNTREAGRVTSLHDFFVRKTVSCWKRRRKSTVLGWKSNAPPVVTRSVSLAAIEKMHSQENVWAVHGRNSGTAQLCVPSRTTIFGLYSHLVSDACLPTAASRCASVQWIRNAIRGIRDSRVIAGLAPLKHVY